MVGRVLTMGGQNAAMKVSLTGFDVQTANQDQLAFDSRYSGFSSFMEGTTTIVSGGTATIPYPYALPDPPLMLLAWNTTTFPSAGDITPFIFRGQSQDNWLYGRTSTNGAYVDVNYLNRDVVVWYKLFRRLLG